MALVLILQKQVRLSPQNAQNLLENRYTEERLAVNRVDHHFNDVFQVFALTT